MATIINNPPSNNTSEKESGMGLWIGIIVVILLLAAFFVYGLPAIRGSNNAAPSTVNIGGSVTPPAPTPGPTPAPGY